MIKHDLKINIIKILERTNFIVRYVYSRTNSQNEGGKEVLVCPTTHNLAVTPVSFKIIQICPKQYGIFVCHTVRSIYKNIYVPSEWK